MHLDSYKMSSQSQEVEKEVLRVNKAIKAKLKRLGAMGDTYEGVIDRIAMHYVVCPDGKAAFDAIKNNISE